MATVAPTAARVTIAPPTLAASAPHRFTVEQYHRMIDAGVISEKDRVELIHGIIVQRPPLKPPHATAVSKLNRRFLRVLPDDIAFRVQSAVTLTDSQPQPDFVIAAGTDDDYRTVHPTHKQILLVVEVSDSTLRDDQTVMLLMYAAAKIPVYWIVNLKDRRIEVYTDPRGGKKPTYRTTATYAPGQAVPVTVAGKTLGSIPVSELLP